MALKIDLCQLLSSKSWLNYVTKTKSAGGPPLHPMLCPLGTGDFHKAGCQRVLSVIRAECHSWQLLLEGQHFVYTRQSAIEGSANVKSHFCKHLKFATFAVPWNWHI